MIDKINYRLVEISTTNARTNKEIIFSGSSILVVQSPVNIDIRLHRVNNDAVTIQQNDSVIERFEKFYITHAALSGGTIKLLVYNEDFFKIVLGGRSSTGGGASIVNNDSLALTLASTEYNKAILDSTKKILLINPSVDAVIKFSFKASDSSNGIPLPPLGHKEIDGLDLASASIYAQSDIASKNLYYWEFL